MLYKLVNNSYPIIFKVNTVSLAGGCPYDLAKQPIMLGTFVWMPVLFDVQ